MQRVIRNILVIVFCIWLVADGSSQTILTLNDIVKISSCSNLTARQAMVKKKTAYWDWMIHRSNLRPQLVLGTNLAEFTKGVTPVSQEDGSIAIKTVNQNSSTANLYIEQPLPAIGANIFVNSYLYRFDNFVNSTHSYSAQPIEAGISLPVFQFNDLKWDKRIEPVIYDESKRQYNRNIELSVLTSVQLFFNCLSDRHDYEIAHSNKKVNAELYRISEEKYNKGFISRDELLQMKLMLVNAEKKLKAANVQSENSTMLLLAELSLTDINQIKLIEPTDIPTIEISAEKAIRFAEENNPESVAFKRRLLEAERDMAKARGETGVNGNVYATLGYGSDFNELKYWNDDLNQHATLEVGLTIPILDWGRSKAARKKASMSLELEQTVVMQEQINLENEITALVNIVEMLGQNLDIVKNAQEIAFSRYEIAYNRFKAGDISVLELDLAQKEKDYASQDLLDAKSDFWINYYKLRSLTLYDFVSDKSLNENSNN